MRGLFSSLQPFINTNFVPMGFLRFRSALLVGLLAIAAGGDARYPSNEGGREELVQGRKRAQGRRTASLPLGAAGRQGLACCFHAWGLLGLLVSGICTAMRSAGHRICLALPAAGRGQVQTRRQLHGDLSDFIQGTVTAAGDVAGDVVQAGAEVLDDAFGAGGNLAAAGQAANEGIDAAAAAVGEGVGDFVDGLVEATPEVLAAIANGRGCWMAIGRGVRAGALVGPTGAIVGGASAALLSLQECVDAVKYGINAAQQVLDTQVANLDDVQCAPGQTPVNSQQVGVDPA